MESFSPELSQRRVQAVLQIKARVAQHVGTWLADYESVAIAIAAATRVAEETLEYLCKPVVAKKAIEKAKALAVTADEWDALFGAEARPLRASSIEPLTHDAEFAQAVKDVGDALRTTLDETEQKQIWSRKVTQAACTIAMHVEQHETYVSSCLGNIVRSDLRRLEDLQCKLEDDGPDEMLMGCTLTALAKCVV
jgi:hypothetical protein